MTAPATSASITPRLPNSTEQAWRPRTSERLLLFGYAFGLTTFFALLYALRGGVAALDRGETVDWGEQVFVSLVVWWACLPLWPLLAWLVRIAPLGREHLLRNGAILLAGTLGAAAVRHYLLTPVVLWVTGTTDSAASAVARTLTYFTTFLIVVGLQHAVHYYRGLRRRELEAADIARALAEARLSALRTQLQPHFMFNALNAIAALLHTDPMRADRMLTRFAALLRFVLQSGVADEHALRDEVEVLRQYLALMEMRFGDRLHVEWGIDPALLDRPVPWMVLQPLVENALEHGVGDRPDPAHLRISAAAEGDGIVLSVEDDGVGIPPSGVTMLGVGLGNTRERLAQLYGESATLRLEPRREGGTRAIVHLPALRTVHGR